MIKKVSIVLLILVVVLSILAGCAKPAPTPTPTGAPAHDIVRVPLLMTAYGSGYYEGFAVLEQVISKRHPWLRLITQESAGHLYNAQIMGTEKNRWKTNVFGLDPVLQVMAEQGVAPLFEKKFPDIAGFRGLFNYVPSITTLVTLNPQIKTARDLDGKRVGLGLKSQSGYTQYPLLMLTEGYQSTARIEHIAMGQLADALLNGTVDAIVNIFTTDFDWKSIDLMGPTVTISASQRAFYQVGFEKDVVEKIARDKGTPFIPVTIPANSIPNQPNDVGSFLVPYFIFAHETFPEDIAYEITKTALELQPECATYHAMFKPLTPKTMAWGLTSKNAHPGAIRAYKEAGLWKE